MLSVPAKLTGARKLRGKYNHENGLHWCIDEPDTKDELAMHLLYEVEKLRHEVGMNVTVLSNEAGYHDAHYEKLYNKRQKVRIEDIENYLAVFDKDLKWEVV